jgi:hypothetical protein
MLVYLGAATCSVAGESQGPEKITTISCEESISCFARVDFWTEYWDRILWPKIWSKTQRKKHQEE